MRWIAFRDGTHFVNLETVCEVWTYNGTRYFSTVRDSENGEDASALDEADYLILVAAIKGAMKED